MTHFLRISASPKGFGGDRKAPEIGREPLLGFFSPVWGGAESRAGSRSAPLTWFVRGQKDAPVGRCFLRVQEDNVSGAAYGLSTPKRAVSQLLCPTYFKCSAGVVAYAPSGTLSHTLLGPAPDPAGALPRFFRACEEKLSRQGYRALDRGTRFAF